MKIQIEKHNGGVAMFEKEAEEILNKHCNCEFISECIEGIRIRCSDFEEKKKLLLEGIDFGYSKANEWHKQDIDDIYDLISKDWSIRYFICIMKDKSRVPAIGNCDEACNGEVSVNLFFEYDDEKYYIDDIVWWKEIILPKE